MEKQAGKEVFQEESLKKAKMLTPASEDFE